MNDTIFADYGGSFGTISLAQRRASYWMAEIQVTNYIGAPLLPIIVSGTFNYANKKRIPTDYGYVSRLLSVNVLTQNSYLTCDLQSNAGCGFIYEDTFGYIDFKQVASVCGLVWYAYPYPYVAPSNPYQVQLVYEAGLPTGTANQPGILEALTILTQIDLNEKFIGNGGMNEGAGDIGIQEFRSLDYAERRADHTLIQTTLGGSARAMRAKRMIDSTVKRARKVLLA